MAERTPSPAGVARLPVDGAPAQRRTGPFRTARDRRRYRLVVAALAVVGLASTAGILLWGNEAEPGSRAFWLIAQMRVGSLAVIALVALCHAFATVSFHTATGNRIITPSIMGFEALYIAVQTTVVFLLGAAGVSAATGVGPFLGQAPTAATRTPAWWTPAPSRTAPPSVGAGSAGRAASGSPPWRPRR